MKQLFSSDAADMAKLKSCHDRQKPIEAASVEELIAEIMRKTRGALTVGEAGETVAVRVEKQNAPGVELRSKEGIGLLIYGGQAFQDAKQPTILEA